MQRKLAIGIVLFTLAVAVLGSGALYAYFSDSQTADDNTFTSGTLLLNVGTMPGTAQSISLGTMKPGDAGNAANWSIRNAGSISGDLTVGVGIIANNENGVNAAEIAAGEAPGDTAGDLGNNLKVAFWVDKTNDGWSSGDYYLVPGTPGTTVSFVAEQTSIPDAAYLTLNSYNSKTWTNLVSNIGGSANVGNFKVDYKLPGPETGNDVQGDSAVFDILFTLNQHI